MNHVNQDGWHTVFIFHTLYFSNTSDPDINIYADIKEG